MPEPTRDFVRPIHMKRVAVAAVAALLVLAGCGSSQQQSVEQADTTEGSASTVGSCAGDSPEVTNARTLARVDLDGDGTAEAVKLTGGGGECANTVFARTGKGFVSSDPVDGPPVTSALAVTAPGQDGQLLVTRAEHPRGGYQLRVYAADGDDALTELEVDGNPLVPFVATDVQEHPLSIDCADGGLVLTEAVLHEPMGAQPTWDITRTSYAVDGASVRMGTTEDVADNVCTAELGTKYPELVKHTAFASCGAGG